MIYQIKNKKIKIKIKKITKNEIKFLILILI